jgi:hypothetical protein
MTLYDSKDTILYMAQYDITTYTTEAGLTGSRNLHEATTFGSAGAKFHPGTDTPTLSWSGLYDDGTSGSEVIVNALKGASSESVISYYPGTDAIGKLSMASGGAWIGEDPAVDASVGSLVVMSASINMGLVARSKSAGIKSTITSSTSGTSIDDADSSSSGGSWVYHIFALSAVGGSARWHLNLQHSSNNSSWSDVSSATVTASDGVGAAKTAFTGTLNRYVRQRLVLDASSGSITFAISYFRA